MKTFKLTDKRELIEAVIGLGIFCIISYLSRFIIPLFGLVVVLGIAFPLIWAKVKKNGLLLDLLKNQ